MRSQTMQVIGTISRSANYVFGGTVIALAIAVAVSALGPMDIFNWLHGTVGIAFIFLFAVLVIVTIFCWTNILTGSVDTELWLEAGLHAASGIATAALTFTLLGISLGIGVLAEQTLTPASVQPIISDLTHRFSLAFFTTVIGLPVSAALRALLLVTYANKQPTQPQTSKTGVTL